MSDIFDMNVLIFCALIWNTCISCKRTHLGSICGMNFMTFCLYMGGFGEDGGDANPGYLGSGRLCQKFLWNRPKISLYRNDFFCVFWHKLRSKVHIIWVSQLGTGRLCQNFHWNWPKFSLYRNDFFCVYWHKLSPKVHIL